MDGWLIALLVLVSYGALVILLNQVGALQRLSIQAVGPLLIWRTLRFRTFIEWLSRPGRVWRAFGDFSIGFAFLSMVLMVALLAWIATQVVRAPAGAVRVEQIIGLPAINPFIPLWYGIFGLAVAILVHEGCHGVLARAESIAVRSVGLLLFVVPIGAFVEPDESEMRKAPLRRRLRIFSVGPSSNLVLALVCALIFSGALVGSAKPVGEGAYVEAVFAGSPAHAAGLRPNTLITAIQLEGQAEPVHLAGFRDFSAILSNSTPLQEVTFHYMTSHDTGTITFELGEWPADWLAPGENRTSGFVGVRTVDPSTFLAWARPGERIMDGCKEAPPTPGIGCVVDSLGAYLRLPVLGLSPLPPERQWLYQPTGAAAAFGGAFWLVADAFYWLFWLNFMVGTFNAVPMLPLDGGHMYRDGVLSFLRRSAARRSGVPGPAEPPPEPTRAAPGLPTPREDDDFLGISADRRPLDEVFGPSRDPLERRAHTITVYTSLAMLALIVWPLVWSYASYAIR